MYCRKCGTQNDDKARFCQKCGQPFVVNSAQPTSNAGLPPQPIPTKKRKNGCLTAILIAVGVVVVGAIGIFGISLIASLGTSSTPSAPPLSRDEFVKSCSELDYDLYARQPDENKGKNIMFSGEIIQTMGENSVSLRVALRKPTDPSPDHDRIVYVTYRMNEGEPRLLEGDIIQIYGVSAGLETYLSVLGGEIKIPKVNGRYIESLTKTEPGATAGAIVQQAEGTIGQYDVKILEASKGTSYDSKPVVIIAFEWVNNSSESAEFSSVLEATAYQDGIELETGYMTSEAEIDYGAANKKIQPGASQTVYYAYETSSSSELLIEVTAAFGFDDKVKIAKSISLD